MANRRYILRFSGPGPIPEQDRKRIGSAKGVKIVDGSSRMLLIESNAVNAEQLIESKPDWKLIPEQTIGLPDPRPKVAPDPSKGSPDHKE
jgi:hypothetical protein